MQGDEQIKILNRATYVYLALPLFIFLASWLDYGIALIMSLLFATGFYYLYSDIKNEKLNLNFNKNEAVSAFIIALVWCFCAGIGYFYYQSFDYHFRNAVFRDLINYSWPVFYDKADTPMVYYMGFWLVPAALAKFIYFLGSPHIAFLVGNIYLLLYAIFGVILLFFQLAVAVKAQNFKQFLLAVLIFIAFSGLDIIGYKFFVLWQQPFEYHLDWWASIIQYSSITTSMFWVFNQFIPAALGILLIYNERQIQNFGFLVPVLLILSPYPTVGVCIFMGTYAVYAFYKAENKIQFIKKDIFSIPNIIGVFFCLPIVALYFTTNTQGINRWEFFMSFIVLQRLLLFMLLEFLLYAFVLCFRYRKDVFFITAVIALMLIPFLRLDTQNNFCMRASQPGLVLLAMFSIRFLFENYQEKKHQFLSCVLVIFLLIGSATPFVEFYRGIHYTLVFKKIALVQDDIHTLNKAFVRMPLFGWDANHQYTARNYRTDIFWQYLAHRNIPDMR